MYQFKGAVTVAAKCLRKVYISGGPENITVDYNVLNKNAVTVKLLGSQNREV